MGLQRLAAFVKRDGIFKLDFALLQPGDDAFQFAQSGLETEAGDLGPRRCAGGGDGTAPGGENGLCRR
jgi:hypothetical protein